MHVTCSEKKPVTYLSSILLGRCITYQARLIRITVICHYISLLANYVNNFVNVVYRINHLSNTRVDTWVAFDYLPFVLRGAMTSVIHNEAGHSSSTSFSSHDSDTHDDRMIAAILSEEYAKLDGAVGQRLTNLPSIPHVPRINTFIPNYSDANLDHQRIFERLHAYGLFEVKVSGDGNCQFRAISDQLYRSPEYHKFVRKEVVKQLKEFRSLYEGYVPMKYKQYCRKMRKSGEWGDHVTLQAAADKFGAKICLLTSFRDTCFVEIVPRNQAPQRVLWLSFWSEVHYNSLYELKDMKIEYKPRKKHWLF